MPKKSRKKSWTTRRSVRKLPGLPDKPIKASAKKAPKKPSGNGSPSAARKKEECSLHLDWTRGPDMPVGMTGHIQSVEINGTIYVGGGSAQRRDMDHVVMIYDTQSSHWDTLPPYRGRTFAMTSINGKLVLVGGSQAYGFTGRELGEWQTDCEEWIQSFPLMSEPRWCPIAISFKNWLLVAGGAHYLALNDTIEILDVDNMQWSSPLPAPTKGTTLLKSVNIGSTWYIMGGCKKEIGINSHVYSASLEALVSPLALEHSSMWKQLATLNFSHCNPLNIGESLLAVGGKVLEKKDPISTIHRYVSETDTWIPIGELPHSVSECTCLSANGKVYIIDGCELFYSSIMCGSIMDAPSSA